MSGTNKLGDNPYPPTTEVPSVGADQLKQDITVRVGVGDTISKPKESAELQELRAKAEAGDPESQNSLGVMYLSGEGVPQDYKQAYEWLTKAAEQGFAEAQNHLGIMHANGKGTEQNYVEALKWFTKAAEQGLAEARARLEALM